MENKVRWEYRIALLDKYGNDPEQTMRDNQMLLDSLGLDGWELVAIRKDMAYFKREFVQKYDPAYVDNEQLAKMMNRQIERHVSEQLG